MFDNGIPFTSCLMIEYITFYLLGYNIGISKVYYQISPLIFHNKNIQNIKNNKKKVLPTPKMKCSLTQNNFVLSIYMNNSVILINI